MKDINALMPRVAVIEDKKQEMSDMFSLKFTMLDDEKFFFEPGQYNMLSVPGLGESAISFSSLPIDDKSFIHSIRIAGNTTSAICSLNIGDKVQVRGPYGTPWPLKKAEGRNIVIVAGGIGMAPLRPVIYHLLQNKKKYKKLFLIYGARTEEGLLYRNELDQWEKSGDIKVFLSVDEGADICFLNLCKGLVTTLLDRIDVPLSSAVSFVCGPEIMMKFTSRGLIQRGQKEKDVFVSMERRMKCAVGHCGHCQIGAKFVCKDGAVFAYHDIKLYADQIL